MFRTIFILLISAGFIAKMPSFALGQSNQSESLIITTYYPSPYGQYGIVKLNPRPKPALACNEGEIIYDNAVATKGLYFCNSTNQWGQLYGGGNGFWAENSTTHNIYNTNTGGRVGIGAQGPESPLAVNGGTLGSNLGNTLALHELGSNVSTNQYLRTFTRRTGAGSSWTTADLYLRRNVIGIDRGFIKWPAGNGDIGFGSVAAELVRINATTGNAGIGTTTPAQKLHVVGNIRVNGGGSSGGNITVFGNVCNGAGKCLDDL